MNKNNKNVEVDNTDKKLHISDVISRLSNLKRYECDIEIDEYEGGGFLTTKMSKCGKFVKWEDIQKLLNDL
jgi:hypothetical protein